MKRILSLFLFMLLSTVIFAQVDSTFVQHVGDFIGSILGKSAGETTVIVIFKVLGVLAALDWLLVIIVTMIPTSSPTKSFFEKVIIWIRSIIGDNKKGGGTFNK